jgi:DDE domain
MTCLNNIVEQDHRAVKRRCAPMLALKSFRTAAVTLAGVELAHRIRKGQFSFDSDTPLDSFLLRFCGSVDCSNLAMWQIRIGDGAMLFDRQCTRTGQQMVASCYAIYCILMRDMA